MPTLLTDDEHAMMACILMVPLLLEQARAAYDGRMSLMKGPEIACRYPVPTDRPYGDIDLLVDDTEEAQRALIAAGFREVGEPELYRSIHHLRPLALDPYPLVIELHHQPKWPEEISPAPSREELLEAAVPSSTNVEGILALHPDHHVICVAAHAWAHEPLLRLGDLIDMKLLLALSSEESTQAVASRWKVDRMWEMTRRTADAVLTEGVMPLPARVWARHLSAARHRTVVGNHLTKWLSPFSDRSPRRGARAAASAVMDDLRPTAGESWSSKWRRTRVAVRNASQPRSAHDEELGEAAHIGDPVRERIAARKESS